MSNRQITIAIDAMGGEGSPFKNLKGAELFSQKNKNVLLKIFGNENLIKKTIENNKINLNLYEIVDCDRKCY